MAASKTKRNIEVLDPKERRDWREWLSKNHASSQGIWVIVSKKKSDKKGISLEDVVEEALCFGWIDSKLNVVDEKSFKLLLTPRKPGSIWSKANKQRVEKLIGQGLMTGEGLGKIEAAKRGGSWNRLDAVEELRVPEDFGNALAANGNAKENFESFTLSAKKQLLWWIESARTHKTRLKRISQAVVVAAENNKAFFSS